ncbi:hypothetical protein HO173_009618 [Letharia columbiana]|uniref:Uncharacterized protein n=1 Tax=Letharia columbiana TaxID=112416 RepID=A0A8H6L1P9_9LECA|nr:uncharacterized protein HO173_009618 [Letharia columbiana]KAF6232235.1 hypothetical protein HO173_009618 [Letharia columbiana]
MLQDRDELARIQSEVNKIRIRRQSAAPTIHQPVPQAPILPAHQPFLFAPPPQPSPIPLQAPQPTLALPQQRTPTPSETEAVPRRSFLYQGNNPMIAPLLLRFKAVDLKYIKQIYHGPVIRMTVLAFSAAAGPKLVVGPGEGLGYGLVYRGGSRLATGTDLIIDLALYAGEFVTVLKHVVFVGLFPFEFLTGELQLNGVGIKDRV